MATPRYVFHSRWEVPSPAGAVYDVLYDLVEYPRWWPEFREVRRITKDRYWMVVKSFLPYRITYTLSREEADRGTGRLVGRVEGDIEGRIGWRIDPTPHGSAVYFVERVETRSPVLNALAPIARLAFDANHQLMMHDGQTGLRALLYARAPHRHPPIVRRPGAGYR